MQATTEWARKVFGSSPPAGLPRGSAGLDSGASRPTVAVGAGIAFLAVLFYAANVDLVHFVGDDGGITLRYAERIAAGLGFNYNDGERVNGCSNPLFTLALSGLLRLGLDPADAVRMLAAGGLAGAAAILFSTFARFYSVASGVFVAFACVAY